MTSVEFAYVILHYNVPQDTERCVASIKANAEEGSCAIIIVDNNSPDGSGAALARKYEDDASVRVILNKKNEGFARGNNRGFVFAKRKLGAQFVVLMNNDTELRSKDFQRRVKEEYEASKCGVIGPRISTPSSRVSVNVAREGFPRLAPELWEEVKLYINWFLSYWNLDLWVVRTIGQRGTLRGGEKAVPEGTGERREENVMLQGSCLIFTPAYVSRFDGLNPHTFLYNEENILCVRCRKSRMLTVYLPDIEVFHKEKSATGTLPLTTERKKRQFRYKHVTWSKWVLIWELLKR